MSAPYNGDYYNVEYDFIDEILDDWVPETLHTPSPQQQRPASPKTEAAIIIYDGMAGLCIAEDDEVFATEYADLTNYILDNTGAAAAFLKENGPICNALLAFTEQMDARWPCSITLTTAMRIQLEIIAETK